MDNIQREENIQQEEDFDKPQGENYTHYCNFSPEEQYQYCLKRYGDYLAIDNRQKFKKSLNMRYYLNNNYHNFYYDYDMDKFLLNSNESETAEHITTLNQMIMYLRVQHIGPASINWVNPFYSKDIQYLSDDSKWYPLSNFL